MSKNVDLELLAAARKGDIKAVKEALAENACITHTNNTGETALHIAIANEHQAIALLLLNHAAGRIAKLANREGNTPLHYAAEKGYTEVVEKILDAKVDIDNRNEDGWTALHFAVSKNQVEVVRLLLSKKPNLHIKTERGNTVLHFAADKGYNELVIMLVNAGADVRAQNNRGNTALHWAATNGNPVTIHLLIREFADPLATNVEGSTPLNLAKDADIKLALSTAREIQVQHMRAEGSNDLHIAAAFGTAEEILRLLPSYDIDGPNELKNTPLHVAARCRNAGTMKALLERGARWELVNGKNQTAIEMIIGDAVLEDVASRAAPTGTLWARLRCTQAARIASAPAIDQLMNMLGLRAVKEQVVKLVQAIVLDEKRDKATRVTPTYNFVFVGNPGTGKTTVARLLATILGQLGVRASGKCVEKKGQQLLLETSMIFPTTLASATPGVLFIDEVYQLQPHSDRDGKAITNLIMDAAEEHRKDLTIVCAGYPDEVNKWLDSNPSLRSRFPYKFEFEDYTQAELKQIFLGLVRQHSWILQPPQPPEYPVDIATLLSRRVSRGRGHKGFGNARSIRDAWEKLTLSVNERLSADKSVHAAADLITVKFADVALPALRIEELSSLKSLDKMIGLRAVKERMRSMAAMAASNSILEIAGKPFVEVALHRVFLGNPGTGKTTVAKLYGAMLRELKLISNGDVIVKGASELIGGHVGETPARVNAILNAAVGNVLVIDEAYSLFQGSSSSATSTVSTSSSYGKEALDTLVERVQGLQDFAVVLCGYETEMRHMMDANPGLARRFQLENAFRFEDYSDAELQEVLLTKAKEVGLSVTPEAAAHAVKEVLSPQRAKPHFGNAGAVTNLLDAAKLRMRTRDMSTTELVAADFLDAEETPGESLEAMLLGPQQNVRDHIEKLKLRVQRAKERGKDVRSLLRNYVFLGPPGTGKTTVASLFGRVFQEIGILSDSRVIVRKAGDLMGSYMGQTKDRVNGAMRDARGGVLFIDEAYGLLPTASSGGFAKEALEALMANMTHPDYMHNMVVIIAGYDDQMHALLDVNEGLRSRFQEHLHFQSWGSDACLEHLKTLAAKESWTLPDELATEVNNYFQECARRPGWANARDVQQIFERLFDAGEDRIAKSAESLPLHFTASDVNQAFMEFLKLRPAARTITLSAADLVNRGIDPQLLQSAPPEMPRMMQPVTHAVAHEEATATAVAIDGDDGDDDTNVAVPLERALAECNYTAAQCLEIVESRNLPPMLVERAAEHSKMRADKCRVALVAQCGPLVPRFRAVVAEEKRLAALKAADLAKYTEEIRVQEKIRAAGLCPMGFVWQREGAGYRCAGGGHYMSDADLK